MLLRARLEEMKACRPAIEWLGDRDLATAWAECERGDWMLWLAGRLEVDRRILVRAAALCAREALARTTDERVHRCVQVTLAWCDGQATDEEVRQAAAAAYAAADAAYAADVAAAAYAADAAYAAAYAAAAADAADAAYAPASAAAAYAAAAAADAAYAAASRASLLRSADIVRETILLAMIAAALDDGEVE